MKFYWKLLGAHFDFFSESKNALGWVISLTTAGCILLLFTFTKSEMVEYPFLTYLFIFFCLGPFIWLPFLSFLFSGSKRQKKILKFAILQRIRWWQRQEIKNEITKKTFQKDLKYIRSFMSDAYLKRKALLTCKEYSQMLSWALKIKVAPYLKT